MPDPRNYLRDRGLDNGPDAPQPAPFRVNLDTGQIVGTEPEQPAIPIGLPDDYPARVLAVKQVGNFALSDDGFDETMTIIHRLHAFLTATEKPEPAPKERIHTDK